MLPGANLHFDIQAFDSSIRVEGADAEIRDALDRYIFPSLPRTRSTQPSPDIILRVERNGENFNVLLDRAPAGSASALLDAVLAAVKALDDAVVRHMKMFRAVHAGAVLINDKALLLPGSSHAGKSSLVAELLRMGATHFSDEYALIDREGRIHSYPRPLLLRDGSLTQSLVLPQELNAAFAARPAAIGWIFALHYIPAQAWDVQKVSQGEAVMLLLRNTPHEMVESPEMVDFFLRVAADATSYEGKRGEAADAASQIFDLICRR